MDKKYKGNIGAIASAVYDVNAEANAVGQTDFFAELNISEDHLTLKIGFASKRSDYVETACLDREFRDYAYHLCLRWLENMHKACKTEDERGGEA